MLKQAFGKLKENENLVSGHMRVPLLHGLFILLFGIGVVSLWLWLKIAAMLSHVRLQQVGDLLTATLWVVV